MSHFPILTHWLVKWSQIVPLIGWLQLLEDTFLHSTHVQACHHNFSITIFQFLQWRSLFIPNLFDHKVLLLTALGEKLSEPILKTANLWALLLLLVVYHHLRANISDPTISLESTCECPLDHFGAGKGVPSIPPVSPLTADCTAPTGPETLETLNFSISLATKRFESYLA